MSSSIFQVPIASGEYDPSICTVMVHDLSQPESSSTVQINIVTLLSKLLINYGTISVRLIDNGIKIIPDIDGNTFLVADNEIVIFKTTFNKSDEATANGFCLNLFTKGKGKYKRPGFTDPTAILVSADDFIQIYTTPYANEIYPGDPSLNLQAQGMMTWSSDDEFNKINYQTVLQYFQRLFRDSQSKLNTPILDFNWGGEEYRVWNPTRTYLDIDDVEQEILNEDLVINKLGIKIQFWESFQAFIDQGGVVDLLVYRRNKRKVSLTSLKTITRRKPLRWAHNSKSEFYGGKTIINITQEQDFYDFNAEYLIKRSVRRKSSYIEGNKDLQFNHIKREWLGFAFRFTHPSQEAPLFITPIIATLGLIKMPMEQDWPIEGDQYKMITFQYQ